MCGGHYCYPISYRGLYLIICLITSYSIWSHDYACRPIWSFCSCLSCFLMFFFMFFCVFSASLCGCIFQWHFTDLFSCIAASLFNKLTFLFTYVTKAQLLSWLRFAVSPPIVNFVQRPVWNPFHSLFIPSPLPSVPLTVGPSPSLLPLVAF